MEELKKSLDALFAKWQEQEPEAAKRFAESEREEENIYPFNPVEHRMAYLLNAGILSIGQYEALRNAYFERNKYLPLYALAPRTFGETWGQAHIRALIPQACPPSKKLDPQYEGQYDLWLDGIRIEVKASRAARKQGGGSLSEKALYSTSHEKFDMNFQQIKPACAEVFVWIAIWRDAIKYWVLSSAEILQNKYYSEGQHRGNSGEGQLWITQNNIAEFEPFAVAPEALYEAIHSAAKRR